ncbi:MAG: 3D-(3,5/4)-trihydroxycyclohexane-1,2-dione acylhydrolase (decyclizing) [Thermaerobacter sp.]|nr:3D-(3,5/4)-trihydroxycyclohexane-1,2-dione acylhydrolase (decyclizing) [Thermaerobacter sp.]
MGNRIRLTMAQALLRYLDQQYVERDGVVQKWVHGVIGIFGHGNVLGIGEALEQGVSTLPFIQGHNEQGMVHAAVAFAKQKNRLGIYACTSSIGPGALNMVTAAATATVNRLPVLLLPGDIFADRQPDPVLQQLEYPQDRTVSVNDAFKPVSVFWDRIWRPEQLLASLPEAMTVLTDPAATGAVTLALPQDVQAEAYDYPVSFFERQVWEIWRAPVENHTLETVTTLFRARQRPVIVAGGGVHYAGATEALARFAATFHVPVVETQAGRGALPWSHPWNFGGIGVTGSRPGNQLMREADLVLAIGTRLADFTTASKSLFSHSGATVVGLNVNRRDAAKLNAVPWVADAKRGIEALTTGLARHGYRAPYSDETTRGRRDAWIREMARDQDRDAEGVLSQTTALGVIQETIGPEAVIVAAAGSLPGDLHRLWRCAQAKTYHLEYGFSCMGYEVAGALGVKWAEPQREVYALVGDGSFLLMHSELLTSLQERAKVTVIVFDNGGYGSINSLQKAHGSHGFGTEFRYRTPNRDLIGDRLPVDYARLGEALGAPGWTAHTADALRQALIEARQASRSCVIDVKVGMGTGTDDAHSGAWWRLGVAAVSSSETVQKARDVMEQAQRDLVE